MATYTTEMYNELIKAISLGARQVWYGDKRVAYRSLDEMLRLKDSMEIDLGLKKPQRRFYGDFTKGIK